MRINTKNKPINLCHNTQRVFHHRTLVASISVIVLLFLSVVPVYAGDDDGDNQVYTDGKHDIFPFHETTELERYVSKHNVSGNGVRVAVLDTGIDFTNNDFKDAVIASKDFVSDGSVEDKNSHGTKIASIIAARQDNANVLGIAPDAKLLIGKVANDGGYTEAEWVAAGVDWAIENHAQVINIGLQLKHGSYHLESSLEHAYELGIIVVVAVGNPDEDGDTTKYYPATYKTVLSVAALTDGEMADVPKPLFKEYEKMSPDVYAPGQNITADYFDGKLTLNDGASFATAIVSGTAALALQSNPELSNQQLAELVKQLYYPTGLDKVMVNIPSILMGVSAMVALILILIYRKKIHGVIVTIFGRKKI